MDPTRPELDPVSNADSAAVVGGRKRGSGTYRPGLWQRLIDIYRRHEIVRNLSTLLPSSVVTRFARFVRVKKIRNHPDRKYLEAVIFPCLKRQNFSKILFVGCAVYTKHLGKYFRKTETEYWTTDIDEAVAFCGETGRHVICDAR
ncbi:MAG: hypothetical protein O7B81_03775, partial [Gammaproteobacteria bacterium]|nr:hypothetical protein [Gammaproteobacteria bacterium]